LSSSWTTFSDEKEDVNQKEEQKPKVELEQMKMKIVKVPKVWKFILLGDQIGKTSLL